MKRWFFVLTLLALLPASAHAWWNSDWKYRHKIGLNTSPTGADVKEPVAPGLVAVRLHTGNFLFSDANSDGTDIRFVANDDKTPLKYFVESFDAENQLALFWVQLPSISGSSSAEFFYIYSGNEKAGPAGDSKTVYDPAQLLALEFGEAQPPFKDGSAYATPVTGEGVTADKAGLFGLAASFDGKGLQAAPAATVKAAAGGALTYSVWVKPAGDQTAQLFAWGPFSVEQDGSKLVAHLDKATVSAEGLKAGAWSHVAVVAGEQLVVYLNGVEAGAVPAKLPELSGTMTIGAGYRGSMDSLGLVGSARPAAAIRLAASQGADGKLLTVGEDEAAEDGASSSYITILFSSLTVDAKVVIGILAVMFAIAVSVMVSKAIMVSRTDAQNSEFLEGFTEKEREYLDPDSPVSKEIVKGRLAYSTLVPLYATGMRELRLRAAAASSGQLQAVSVAAIKASIDASLIRENQKLNRRMVLLTIAISGGPFLGLLGTVVGVMITFAAIAAQGDVNINAIAPGIAAALLATVAGLTVAIPSLFGYNYLITRIKGITADMQAFADEFICKMAESRGGG